MSFPPVDKGSGWVWVPVFIDDLVKVKFALCFAALVFVTKRLGELNASVSIHTFCVPPRIRGLVVPELGQVSFGPTVYFLV